MPDLASCVQRPCGVDSSTAFAPHAISRPVTIPTYNPVAGAAVALKHKVKAVWAEQYNNLAIAERQPRVPQQQTKEDVCRAARSVKREIESAEAVIANIADKKARKNAKSTWNKAIRPFREHYAKVRCVAAQLSACGLGNA